MAANAVVRVGSIEMPYVRAGQGAPVLLFAAGTAAAIAAGALFTRLSREFRVVAPVFDTDPPDPRPAASLAFPLRLRDLLEGLGIERPLLVAERKCEPLLRLISLVDNADIAALVIYGTAEKDPALDDVIRLLRNAVDERTPRGS